MIEFKSSTLADDYAHVYVGDGALDLGDEEKANAYRVACETNDADKLPLKEGQEPTLFWLRHPTGAVRAYLQDLFLQDAKDHPTTVALEAVACCLQKVTNGDCELDHMVDRHFRVRRLTSECLARLAEVDELGLVQDLGGRIATELYLKKKR